MMKIKIRLMSLPLISLMVRKKSRCLNSCQSCKMMIFLKVLASKILKKRISKKIKQKLMKPYKRVMRLQKQMMHSRKIRKQT